MSLQEKCLAKVDAIEEEACWYQSPGKNDSHMHYALDALRSVIVRHRVGINEGEHHCIDCERDYPCPELRDIAKELGL